MLKQVLLVAFIIFLIALVLVTVVLVAWPFVAVIAAKYFQ